MPLTGTYLRAIDEKFRVAIPRRLRESLPNAGHGMLYVAPGTDGSLALYDPSAFDRIAERLAGASPTQEEVRAFRRLFFAQSERLEVDRQGRIRIPPRLVELAGLSDEAVLIGVDDHLELWDRRRWESYLGSAQPRYDDVAEAAFKCPPAQAAASPSAPEPNAS